MNSCNFFPLMSCSIQEKDITLSGEHVREGLTCVISVKVPNPEFEGQTKVLFNILYINGFFRPSRIL